MKRPLDGVLVADFSRVLAGPLSTMLLADLGAEVIKVEMPQRGDDTRTWGPPWTANSSAYFESANRSKRSVTFDLSDPADLTLARELARRADVLVENFKSGSLDRKGLGYADVAATNPAVIYCSITGFGSAAGAQLPGYDFLAQAVGGLMSITGESDEIGGSPMKVGVALVDVLTSRDAAIGIMAALRARDRCGQGQHVQVNLLSSLLASLVNQASTFLSTGEAPTRMGNAHPSIAPYELLRCVDAPLAVAVGNDTQFRRMAETLGEPALAQREMYSTNACRVSHREELRADLERLLAVDTARAWAERLSRVGVPAGTVGTIADGFALADALGLQPLVPVGDDAPPQVRNPVTYSRTPVTSYSPPPGLGEHNEEVRAWLSRAQASPPE